MPVRAEGAWVEAALGKVTAEKSLISQEGLTNDDSRRKWQRTSMVKVRDPGSRELAPGVQIF